ncbi:MAG: hypothetical protein HYR96_11680 [Deltaproteobacteria bacterium]|nr:hypothetical protein [Deltaproteobacteria bacterium]MBI3294962.1 hypothetical protein [Deltaproteobacteria bacterium]
MRITLILFSLAFVAGAAEQVATERLFRDLQSYHSALELGIETLKPEVPDIQAELPTTAKDTEKLAETVKKFPWLELVAELGISLTDGAPLMGKLDAANDKLHEITPQVCFGPSGKEFNSSKAECKGRLERFTELGFQNGSFFITTVDVDFLTPRRMVDSYVTFQVAMAGFPPLVAKYPWSGPKAVLLQFEFAQRQLASLLGFSHPPAQIIEPTNPIPAWLPDLTDAEVLIPDHCFGPVKDKEVQKRFEELKTSAQHYYGLVEPRLKKRQETCDTKIGKACSDIEENGVLLVLSYMTQFCQIRRVTLWELRRDLKEFRVYQRDTASLVSHVGMLKRIELCMSAFNAGYHWKFQSPIRAGCED